MTQDAPSAKDVSQDLLKTTGDAIKSGDFDRFISCLLIPQTINTFDGRRVIKSSDEARVVFDGIRKQFLVNNITDMVRTCVEAEYRDPDTIVSTHVTRILSGDTLVEEPYPVLTIIKRTPSGWKKHDCQYAVHADHLHLRVLSDDTPQDTDEDAIQSA